MIEFTIFYLVVAIFVYFFADPIIKGGNPETEFFFNNYLNTNLIHVFASLMWFPVLVYTKSRDIK